MQPLTHIHDSWTDIIPICTCTHLLYFMMRQKTKTHFCVCHILFPVMLYLFLLLGRVVITTYTSMHILKHKYAYTNTHMHAYTCTCKHMHTHAHPQMHSYKRKRHLNADIYVTIYVH
ncbi:Hypothetical predicted protein [Octopus vulgaris]|uniref:Uncharacterized protein n=1 Tax=Octopus vulgaris TaxID=6645 RepID=A0AA36F6B0_OCTVU|nr:Hypothetical predicted protein [Octopus vulgaris]